jgi:hypothetical protein
MAQGTLSRPRILSSRYKLTVLAYRFVDKLAESLLLKIKMPSGTVLIIRRLVCPCCK